MDDHSNEFAEKRRFNTAVFISLIVAVAAASPMLERFASVTAILALTYVPAFALAYIGMTSVRWQRYFGRSATLAIGAGVGALTLVALVITRMIAAVFHASNGMYG
jgi:hypothetical protein